MEGESPNELYRECLRNHAASLGSYATDGCREFTSASDDSSPPNFQCIACGCHRNFHRKVTDRGVKSEITVELLDYAGTDSGQLASFESPNSKKRFRTKFTADQKEKMLEFAEKLGWKLQRKDLEDEIERFCRGVGISRQVFKIWMHNHKNSSSSSSSASTCNASSLTQ